MYILSSKKLMVEISNAILVNNFCPRLPLTLACVCICLIVIISYSKVCFFVALYVIFVIYEV